TSAPPRRAASSPTTSCAASRPPASHLRAAWRSRPCWSARQTALSRAASRGSTHPCTSSSCGSPPP
ncbi:hypothetical protein MNEG_9884, partial [Monoraphidium neglectum]